MTNAGVAEKGVLTQRCLTLGEVELDLYEGGEGQPLVFLHGAGGLRPDSKFVELLCRRFRFIAPMHPGFGKSSLPNWMDSIDDFAHVHLDLLDYLGLERVVLIGASIGGWTAAELATKNTSRLACVVMVGPVGIKVGSRDHLDFPDVFATPQKELDRMLYRNPEKWRFDPTTKTDDELFVLARNRETFALVAWEPYLHNPKLGHRLHRINRPTLLLRGASDGLVSQDYLEAYTKLIPGARCEAIPEAGHSPQLEQPEAFVERIVRFAEAQGAAR